MDFNNQSEQIQVPLKKDYVSPILVALDYSIEANPGANGDAGGAFGSGS